MEEMGERQEDSFFGGLEPRLACWLYMESMPWTEAWDDEKKPWRPGRT